MLAKVAFAGIALGVTRLILKKASVSRKQPLIMLWLTGAQKDTKPTEVRPVASRVMPGRVRGGA